MRSISIIRSTIVKKFKMKKQKCFHLLSLLLVGGSSGGIETGVFTDTLLGGIRLGVGVVDLADIDGLPAEAERTEGTCSAKFLPN